MDKVGIFQKIRELFDEAPKRMCDETGRAELERELEEGINRDITIMLGYQPPILIKPVIALNKEARSAVLEELKIVPTSTDYIAITVNMEGGAEKADREGERDLHRQAREHGLPRWPLLRRHHRQAPRRGRPDRAG